MRIKFKFLAFMVSTAMLCSITSAQSISVNFHVGDDDTSETPAQAEHELAAGETAGFVPVDGASWNNISVGDGAAHNTAEAIFASTTLTDDMGNASAATIAPSVDSTWFVGYAASSAGVGAELDLAGNDDDLFNSYLALNGPLGDGTPADAAILSVTGLGADFTTNGYDLIIYSDTDRGGANTSSRTSIFEVTPPAGGAAITVSTEENPTAPNNGDATFSGTYVLSDGMTNASIYENYVVVSGLTASSFDLSIYADASSGRGGINGFQIVANVDLDCLLGDVDVNGEVNFADIAPFIAILANGDFRCEADVDENTEVNFADIGPFIGILSGS